MGREFRKGQWVRFQAEDKKEFTGFIIGFNNDNSARVAVPSIRKTLTVPFILLHDHESVRFQADDIDSMIDVALSTRDFEWMEELVTMKNMLQGK